MGKNKKNRHPLMHKLKYIDWNKEAQCFNLKYDEFIKLYNILEKDKRVKTKTLRDSFKDGCWNYYKSGDFGRIAYFKDNKYLMYVCHLIDDSKNRCGEMKGMYLENKGRKALKGVKDQFKEQFGVTFRNAFGTVDKDFLRCVPSQFYYKGKYTGVIDNVSSVDFCSHYPACMCGRLPNSNAKLVYNGTVKPNEEYPFAFYIKSGHCAEYGVFDTHDWLNSDYALELFKKHKKMKNWDEQYDKHLTMNENDDITILMKASAYELTNIYEKNYELRKVDENAKLIMNSSIGAMHTMIYKDNKYAHLSCIGIARATQKILDVANKIGKYFIIQIVVDGIIYKGNEVLGVYDKKLGLLEQEYAQKTIFYDGVGRYIVSELKSPNLVEKWKHQGCDYNKDGIRLDDNYKPSSIYDILNWVKKVKEGELYEEES